MKYTHRYAARRSDTLSDLPEDTQEVAKARPMLFSLFHSAPERWGQLPCALRVRRRRFQ